MRIGLGLVLTALVLVALPSDLRGEQLTDKQVRARTSRVKKRATDDLAALRKMRIRCTTCNGTGVQIWHSSGRLGRRLTRKCASCEGRRERISKTSGHLLHYELWSPAFRKQSGGPDAVEAARKRQETAGLPTRVARTYLRATKLVDATHAITWVRFNRDKTNRRIQWDNLSSGEVFALFKTRWHRYPGWAAQLR